LTHVHSHRSRAALGDGEPGGDKGEGWNDDFVAGADAVGFEGDFQGIEAATNGHTMLRANIGGEFRLEGFSFGAQEIPPGIHDSEEGGIHLLL